MPFASRRPYLTVFCLALALRLIYAAVLFAWGGADYFLTDRGDSPMYLELADDMLRSGGFMTAASGVFEPVTERMPLYVVFLACLKFVFGNAIVAAALCQALIDALACVVTAKIASRCGLALAAGLCAAVNLNQISTSALVLTDSLFFALCALTFLSWLRYAESPTAKNAALWGLCAGLAVLTREVMFYAALAAALALPLAALQAGKIKSPPALRHAVLALAALAILLAPILGRNLSRYGSWQLTSQKGSHLSGWVLARAWEAAGVVSSHTEGSAKAGEMIERDPQWGPLLAGARNPFEVSAIRSAFALQELAQVPPSGLAKAWATGAAINLFSPSLVHVPPFAKLPHDGFADTRASGFIEKVAAFLSGPRKTYPLLFLAGVAGVLAWRALQFAGLRSWLASRSALPLLAAGFFWTLYVLAINGPVASPKYRLPFEFVLNIAAAWGWRSLRPKQLQGMALRE